MLGFSAGIGGEELCTGSARMSDIEAVFPE
jgi:hypothetical protein